MLTLSKSSALGSLQPMAQEVEQQNQPPPIIDSPWRHDVENGITPDVVARVDDWRQQTWDEMPQQLKSRPDAAMLLDKSLHALAYESGGNETAVGDGGAAWGGWQDHHIHPGSDRTAQIRSMWNLVSQSPDQYRDWGEGALYEGKPFGAFGSHPYNGGSSGNATGSVAGSTIGQQFSQPTKPIINYTKPQQLPDFDTQGLPAITSGAPTGQLPDMPNLRSQLYQDRYGQQMPTAGDVSIGRPEGSTDNPLALATGAYEALNPDIPYYSDAVRAAKPAISKALDVGLSAASGPAATYTAANELTGGYLPSLGDIGTGMLPVGALDVAATAAQFGKPALQALKGGGAAEGAVTGAARPKLRVVQPGETPPGAMGIAGGPKKPDPAEFIRKAREMGLSDEEIRTSFPGMLEAEAGIDTGIQTTARTNMEQAAKASAAERTYKRIYDQHYQDLLAEGYSEGEAKQIATGLSSREARRAAAQAPEALPEQKPNILATDETRQAMQQARENLGNAAVENPVPGTATQSALSQEADKLERIGGTARSSTDQTIGDIATAAKRIGDPASEIRRQLQNPNSQLQQAINEEGKSKDEIAFERSRQAALSARASELNMAPEDLPFKERQQITADLLRTLDKTTSTKSTEEVLSNAEKRAMRTASPDDVAKWRERIADAEIAAGRTPTDPTLQQALELSGQQKFTPPTDNPNASPLNMSGQGGQMGTSEVGIGYDGPKPAEGPSLNTQRLNRGLTEPAKLEGEGSSIPPPKKPGVNAQSEFGSDFTPGPKYVESAAHRAYREVLSLINSPVRALTYGHEPIFRQGVGFALSHPDTAKEALKNLIAVAKNPEASAAINEVLNAQPFVKAAMESGFFHEGVRPPETFVNRLMNKLPGMQNSAESARTYLNTLRKMGYEQEAQRLFQMGVKDPEEYKSLWNTVSDVTGHGIRGQSLTVGGVSPVFSPQAMMGRFRGLVDPFLEKGAFNPLSPGARSVAIRNLMAIGGLTLTMEGLAKASGLDVKQSLLDTPLGKIEIGSSTIDPTAGYSSIFRMGTRAFDALANKDLTKLRKVPLDYLRGQLGPTVDTIVSTYTGQDWRGRDFNLIQQAKSGQLVKDLYEPIAARSIEDAIKAHGPIGALIAAPSIGAMSVETNTLQAARDKGAEQLNFGKPYADLLQTQKDQVDALPQVKDEAGPPSALRQGSLDIKAKYDTQENGALSQFKENRLAALPDGTPVQNMPDAWMKLGLERRAAAEQFQKEHTEALGGIPESDYKRVTEPYYSEQNTVKSADGTIDFDATAAKRQDYINSLSDKPNGNGPSDKAIMQDAITRIEGNKSDAHQKYDKYIAERKQAGYFDVKPDDPDRAKKLVQLDKANPLQDALNWYWKGGTQDTTRVPTLNSPTAVEYALQMDPKRPAKFAGLDRPINSTPGALQAWRDYAPRIDNYYTKSVDEYKDREADRLYSSSYDKLDQVRRNAVASSILSQVRNGSPELEAVLQYLGDTKNANGEYIVSKAAEPYLLQFLQKYGPEPPKPGTKFMVRQ